ncbi:hypothetical protein ACFOOM_01150 [Streptomyces echinoruber]|uniref:Uncharacterized protein n=1 Tax=Streptomyces echinoruber TaxID=68898 RepID=A0A918V5I2_9ACTN|nr:hypothetical protein [Streptomyces echinoruber]GGZ73011.1 hypothetical protein GCM10010389_08030 [Streptomyces echinoruber]
MSRRISTTTPNRVLTQPATVQACRQDRGTPQERAARAEEAIGQRESAQFHAKASAEAAGEHR